MVLVGPFCLLYHCQKPTSRDFLFCEWITATTLKQWHANGVSLLFTFYSLDHRWCSACRVFVSWIWSSTRGDVDVCVVFFHSSFRSQQIWIPRKRRHYFQLCVDGVSPTAANTPVLFSFLVFFFSFLFPVWRWCPTGLDGAAVSEKPPVVAPSAGCWWGQVHVSSCLFSSRF